MANTLQTPAISPLPAPRDAPVAAAGGGHLLVNRGTPALQTSEWLLLIDNGFQTDAAGTAFQLYDCLATLTAPGGPFLAGLGEYGVESCTPVGQSWELDIPVGDGATQRVKAVRNGFAWLSSLDAPTHIKPNPDYADLDAIVSTYTAADRIVVLVTHMLPEWDGFQYGTNYVAFHTVDHNGFPFAVIPFPPDVAAINLPDWTPQQVMTAALSHELAETLTDPKADGSGWVAQNPADGESDDFAPCLWNPVPVPSAQHPQFTYWVQGYWRNDTAACWDGSGADGPASDLGRGGDEQRGATAAPASLAPAQYQVVKNLIAIAEKYRIVPPLLLLAVTLQESSWQEDAYNGSDPGGGSYGPFQLNQSGAAHPGTAAIATNPWYDYGFPEVKDRWQAAYYSVGADAAWADVAGRGPLIEVFAASAQGSVAWPAGLGAVRYQQALAALEAVS